MKLFLLTNFTLSISNPTIYLLSRSPVHFWSVHFTARFKAAKFLRIASHSRRLQQRLKRNYQSAELTTNNATVRIVRVLRSTHYRHTSIHIMHMSSSCMQQTLCSRHTIVIPYRNCFRNSRKYTMIYVPLLRRRLCKVQKPYHHV